MTWRGHGFGVEHAGNETGGSVVAGHTMATGFGADRLIDGLANALARPAASETDAVYDIDRGTGTLGDLSHYYIPAPHTLSGITGITITGSATQGGVGTPTVVTAPATDETPLFGALAGTLDSRWWRVKIFGSGIFELGEVWLTALLVDAHGWDPQFSDTERFQGSAVRTPQGPVSLATGEPLREIVGRINRADGGDLTLLDSVAHALAQGRRVLYFPPDDTDRPVIVSGEMRERRQARGHPAALGQAMAFDARLREVV